MKISGIGTTDYWPRYTMGTAEKRIGLDLFKGTHGYEDALMLKEPKEKKEEGSARQQISPKEIYQNMRQENGNGTDTEILVKPDGSRVLVMTMHIGSMETTMSMEISKPTDMQNDKGQEAEADKGVENCMTEGAENWIKAQG